MSFFAKLWNSIRSRKLGTEIQQEMETHLALLAEDAREKGLSPQDAQREAGAVSATRASTLRAPEISTFPTGSMTSSMTFGLLCVRCAATGDLRASRS